ncbi:flagellar export chaperone FliS [Congregibacter brevis]|uniref:Flagellar secretion chaperone FliS n=1 Tax=Congregibacter brevis TaxID=3081201 RepID=A0ABZ0IC68_9GAMM|nr:flagellar export chaperone FliS [Congregibacter sp. IMCC45268]
MNGMTAISAYRKVDAQSGMTDASPHQLITMLMDGALSRIAGAKGAMTRGDVAAQGEMLGKAISIIDNMRASLDIERGGEVATRLRDLYDYMESRLVEAASSKDEALLDEVSGLMREIKSGWEAIPEEYRG